MRPTASDEGELSRPAVRQALGAAAALLGVGLVAVDPDGRCWFTSQRWEDRSGSSCQGMGDRPWFDAVHPDDVAVVAGRWRSLLGHHGRLGVFRTVGVDGVVRRCRAESVPMVGADGRVDGYLIAVTDAVGGGHQGGGHQGGGQAAGGTADGGELDDGDLDLDPVLSTPHLLDSVLAGAPDIITILNKDGSWRWSSGAALHLFGHQAEFDVHVGVFRMLHPDDVEAAQEAFRRAVADELLPGERFDIRVRAADGSWRHMDVLMDVLLDEPSVHGIVVHARDATDHHRVLDALAATNLRLADVFSSIRSALLVEDEHGAVLLVNQAFIDMFRLGGTPEDLVGRTVESAGLSIDRLVVDPPDASAQLGRLLAEGRRVEAARAVLFDGRTIECDFVPTRELGTDRGRLWVLRDVTHRARAETEQQRLLVSERDENQRLAEMDAFRSESIAAVSHELRTPLTSIVGYAQLLRNMVDREERPDEAGCIDAISRNVDRLLRLAGDVVALDSLESRVLPLVVGPVDVGQVLGQAVSSVGPEAAGKSVRIDVDAPTDGAPASGAGGERRLRGDAARLVQLFENLLSNAVKFTPSGGTISVVARKLDDGWAVEVNDTGIGIPGDEIELLFGRFFRGSNARARGIPGTGLGLSVARAIVDRHRGTISVRSVVGVGTTVTVMVRDVAESEEER
ncbi:MAG: PAS domain-containing sensor histidine kinase [Acidimicrobiales bacterium]